MDEGEGRWFSCELFVQSHISRELLDFVAIFQVKLVIPNPSEVFKMKPLRQSIARLYGFGESENKEFLDMFGAEPSPAKEDWNTSHKKKWLK